MIDDRNAAGFQRQMSFRMYKKMKLTMLQKDFCLPLTEAEVLHFKSLTTEAKIDQFCVTMLNKYWG